MTIDWWTFGLQAVNFLVLVWLLHRVLYKPVLAVIEKRRQLTEHTLEDARRVEASAEATRQRYEDAEAGLEAERKKMVEETRATVEAERARMLEDARAGATKILAEGRDKIAAERKAALSQMRAEISELGAGIARAVLAGVGPEVPASVFLDRLEATFTSMPDAERRRLADAAKVIVATAGALDEDQRGVWIERLRALLGAGLDVAFTAEPKLIAGAELRFPHTTINDSLDARIDQAKTALGDHD